jgi:hypothetical protein
MSQLEVEKAPMMSFRPFSILAPRLAQILGWTYDVNPHVKPLLSPEDALAYKKNATEALGNISLQLQSRVPLTYTPPRFQPEPSPFQN